MPSNWSNASTDNVVTQLVMQGTQAEYQKQFDRACALYQQAWELAHDDYEACIAAHYVARFQTNPLEILRWNLIALARADAIHDDRVTSFYPSLYINVGRAYELLDEKTKAAQYYKHAADLGLTHQIDYSNDSPINPKPEIENQK